MTIPQTWYGHDPDPHTYFRCKDCGRELRSVPGGLFAHVPRSGWSGGDEQAYFREQEAAIRDAHFASAIPYAGAIERCQARVAHPMGRITGFGRCDRRARWASRKKRERWVADRSPTDVIVCCKQHAKSPDAVRWVQHDPSKYAHGGASADEQVEPEYIARLDEP